MIDLVGRRERHGVASADAVPGHRRPAQGHRRIEAVGTRTNGYTITP